MTESAGEHSTAVPGVPTLVVLDSQHPRRVIRGRNWTKADVRVFGWGHGQIAVKDYRRCPWWVRATFARWFVRREAAAYRAAANLPGLPRCWGRLGPLALATEWIEARPLSELRREGVPQEVFERLEAIVNGLHSRGLALGDLHHRDVLVGIDGRVHVVDLATAWRRGDRRRGPRNWIFERLRAADCVALSRLRARFTGRREADALRDLDPRAVAWHRRGRALKRAWNRSRRAE